MRFLLGIWTIRGAYGSRGSLGVWLAAEEAKKSWNQKILLAKIGADTAENERIFVKILPKTIIGNYPTLLFGNYPTLLFASSGLSETLPHPRPGGRVLLRCGQEKSMVVMRTAENEDVIMAN